MLLVLALWGCKSEEAPPPTEVEVDPDAPYIDPWEPLEVTWDQAAVEASLQTAIDTVIDLDATPVFDAYDQIMDLASPACPDMEYDFDGYSAWVDSCSTDGGAQYSGYAFTESAEVDGVAYSTLAMSATVTGAGRALSGSGYWVSQRFTDGQIVFEGTFLEGQVLLEGPAPDSWITRGLRPSIELQRTKLVGLPFTTVALHGSIGGLDSTMPTAEFIDVTYEPACDEPEGTMSVRNDDGQWFDVRFGDDCDGCGEVSHLGDVLGEACVRFDTWETWEPTP